MKQTGLNTTTTLAEYGATDAVLSADEQAESPDVAQIPVIAG